jgi:AcrR family transcriptional regulator
MATSGARRSVGQSNARSGTASQALVDAAIDSLREVGFAGASARAIAHRAGSTQSQVFYHFGSVVDLLLAALDEVSARRLKAYQPLVETATSPNELLQTARTVILSDLDSGDLKVLVEMVAGAQTVPGLGAQVAQRRPNCQRQYVTQQYVTGAPHECLAGTPQWPRPLIEARFGERGRKGRPI